MNTIFYIWLFVVAVVFGLGVYAAYRIVKDKFKQFGD